MTRVYRSPQLRPAPPGRSRGHALRRRTVAAVFVSAGLCVPALQAPALAATTTIDADASGLAGPAARPGPLVRPGQVAPAAPATLGNAVNFHAFPAGSEDAVREEQWQLDWLDARDAWRHADGAGVTVAVLDSGVDASHPDLAGQVLPGMDFVDGTTDGRIDPVGHGTTVAALIAGLDTDADGVAGLAPKAKILPVRVLNNKNRYEDAATVAKGVRWAVDNGARVINLSLGGAGASEALAEALDYAFDRDVVVVACTGNVLPQSSKQVWYPAREPGVVAVAGLTRDKGDKPLWTSSITGPQTVLAAPAADLLGARPDGYWRVEGTSFAAPLVSATAALIRSHWPEMSGANVVNRLISTARDLGATGRDDDYGFGAVDPARALTADVPTVDRNPLDTNAPHGVAGFGAADGSDAATGSGETGDGTIHDQAPLDPAPGTGLLPDPGSSTDPTPAADPGSDSATGAGSDSGAEAAAASGGDFDSGGANYGEGAKRLVAAPARDRGPWHALLAGLIGAALVAGVAAAATTRLRLRLRLYLRRR